MHTLNRLVDFIQRLLCSGVHDTAPVSPWIPRFVQIVSDNIIKNPRVPPLYVLLQCVMKIIAKNNFLGIADEGVKKSSVGCLTSLINLISKQQEEYEGVLLLCCLSALMYIPISMVGVHHLEILKRALITGAHDNILAQDVIDALISWYHKLAKIDQSKFNELLPLLSQYLSISTSPQPPSSIDIRMAQYHEQDIPHRVIMFLGDIGSSAHLIIPQSANVELAWDIDPKFNIDIPFQDINSSVYFDTLLPKIIQVARSSKCRESRMASFELIHSFVVLLLGKISERKFSFIKYIEPMMSITLELAADVEQLPNEIFEPLCMQIMRWASDSKYMSDEELGIMLDCSIEGTFNRNNSSLREIASNCIAEYIKYCLKRSEDKLKVEWLLRKIENSLYDADIYKRLGSLISMNKVFRIIREHFDICAERVNQIVSGVLKTLQISEESDMCIMIWAKADEIISAITHFLEKYRAKMDTKPLQDIVKEYTKQNEYKVRENALLILDEITKGDPDIESVCIGLIEPLNQLLKAPPEEQNQPMQDSEYFMSERERIQCHIALDTILWVEKRANGIMVNLSPDLLDTLYGMIALFMHSLSNGKMHSSSAIFATTTYKMMECVLDLFEIIPTSREKVKSFVASSHSASLDAILLKIWLCPSTFGFSNSNKEDIQFMLKFKKYFSDYNANDAAVILDEINASPEFNLPKYDIEKITTTPWTVFLHLLSNIEAFLHALSGNSGMVQTYIQNTSEALFSILNTLQSSADSTPILDAHKIKVMLIFLTKIAPSSLYYVDLIKSKGTIFSQAGDILYNHISSKDYLPAYLKQVILYQKELLPPLIPIIKLHVKNYNSSLIASFLMQNWKKLDSPDSIINKISCVSLMCTSSKKFPLNNQFIQFVLSDVIEFYTSKSFTVEIKCACLTLASYIYDFDNNTKEKINKIVEAQIYAQHFPLRLRDLTPLSSNESDCIKIIECICLIVKRSTTPERVFLLSRIIKEEKCSLYKYVEATIKEMIHSLSTSDFLCKEFLKILTASVVNPSTDDHLSDNLRWGLAKRVLLPLLKICSPTCLLEYAVTNSMNIENILKQPFNLKEPWNCYIDMKLKYTHN